MYTFLILCNAYDFQMEFDAFWTEFVHYLKYSMIVFKREAAVERTIDFVAKFVASTVKQQQQDQHQQDQHQQDQQQDGTGDKGDEDAEETKDESNKFLLTILDFLLQVPMNMMNISLS